MKSIRFATIAVLATAAVSAFAAKDTGDRFEPAAQTSVTAPSTLSRAQVHAEAVKANRESHKRLYSDQGGDFVQLDQAGTKSSGLTREAVRSQVIKARSTQIVVDTSS